MQIMHGVDLSLEVDLEMTVTCLAAVIILIFQQQL
jgi:hypothetical protein